MPSLAQQFTRKQIEAALEHIIDNKIRLQPSTRWSISYKNQTFPPKEVVRWAAKLSGLRNWETMSLSGGENTNGPLKKLGFTLVDNKSIRDKETNAHGQASKKYWLYSPGRTGEMWEEFYQKGIMGLGWDELGNLNNYLSKEDIHKKLQEIAGTEESKKNGAIANFEFKEVVNVGDVVIVKRGRGELLGYGIVKSKYYHDSSRERYKNCRKVEWQKKGVWKSDHALAIKTLTDITKYPSESPAYKYYYERLLGLMTNHMLINEYSKNTILFGPPGTGKTYNSIDKAVRIATGSSSDHASNKVVFDRLREEGQIEFVTFHQGYSYEDFMIGLRPDAETETLKFKSYKGVFYQLVERAADNYLAAMEGRSSIKSFDQVFSELVAPLEEGEEVSVGMASGISFFLTDVENGTIRFRKKGGSNNHTLSVETLKGIVEGKRDFHSGLGSYYKPLVELIRSKQHIANASKEVLKNYVLIIDEINRANISKVFGELITLLEDDKRLGADNALTITLPNGEKDFGVPPNLYILGTMNTADKSIALIDIALRRRFEFEGFYPDAEALRTGFEDRIQLLEDINYEIYEKKKTADYLVGHGYFMKEEPTEQILKMKIIPLLMEYFGGRVDEVMNVFTETEYMVEYDRRKYCWEVKHKLN